ncbi:MAG TPA: stage II sporulation protein M [Actinomycetota bacterium]|nr:stage II sporulation protein M [Actinomycetota bacterium]
MNLERFTSSRAPSWAELDRLVNQARGNPKRLGARGVLRLGQLYRGVSADLALARRRWPGDPIEARIAYLVERARPLVYGRHRAGGSIVDFFAARYWRKIKERPVLLGLAALLLIGPGVLAFFWALGDPAAAVGVLPEEFQTAGEGTPAARDFSTAEQTFFASSIFTNNIRVTFLAFAGGAAAGLLTGFILVYNALILGVVLGLVTGSGQGAIVWDLIVAHGVLELSCIIVTAAAGLRIGAAIVDPGTRPRGEVFVEAARDGVEVVFGTIPWLVLAGLVEGYFTPRDLGALPDIAVGIALAAMYWAFVIVLGRKSRVIDVPAT